MIEYKIVSVTEANTYFDAGWAPLLDSGGHPCTTQGSFNTSGYSAGTTAYGSFTYIWIWRKKNG